MKSHGKIEKKQRKKRFFQRNIFLKSRNISLKSRKNHAEIKKKIMNFKLKKIKSLI
jgi:hypothetical protein